jgi:hypothetical protein
MLAFLSKSINTKWHKAWNNLVKSEGIYENIHKKMIEQFETADDSEKKDLINKIKTCRDILINSNDKRPFALTRISDKINERYDPIHYNTLRDKMRKHNIPTDIKEFTKIYG